MSFLEHLGKQTCYAEKFTLITKVREEIQLNEDVKLPGVNAGLFIQIPEQIHEVGVFISGKVIEFIGKIGAHILDGGEPLCNNSLFSVEEILTSGQSPLWQCDADADAGSVIGNGGGLIHVIAKDIECRSEEL